MTAIPALAFAENGTAGTATLVSAAVAYDKGDHAQAAQMALVAAQAGHPASQYLLGSATANRGAPFNNSGVPAQQAEDSNAWLEKAAGQGLVPAMRDAGLLNLLYVVRPNVASAVKWYEAAARRGDSESQQMFGLLRAHGWGVPKDATLAIAWLSLAAEATKDEEQRRLSLQLIRALQSKLGQTQAIAGAAQPTPSEMVQLSPERFSEQVQADIRAIQMARAARTSKQEVAAQKHMPSLPQLRFGLLVGGILNLDPVFGALLYASGGLIGKN